MIRLICIAATISAMAFAGSALAGDVFSSGLEAQVWPTATASEKVKARIVVLNKRKRGALMDIKFRVEFDNVPQGKQYQLYTYDAGMKRDGFRPAPIPDASHRFIPDSRGHLYLTYELDGFSKGEWVQCILRSTDRSIQKSVRFTPYK